MVRNSDTWKDRCPLVLTALNGLEIRSADESDAVHIALLGRITFGETFGHLFRDKNDLLEYYERIFSTEKIRNSLKDSNNKYWLAFMAELPVGYAKLKLDSKSRFITFDRVCQLQKIYVLKDFLGRKVGLELQNVVFQKAREYQCDTIWLSVLEDNPRARAFYKKNGFIENGNIDFDIGKERFNFKVMSKKLGQEKGS